MRILSSCSDIFMINVYYIYAVKDYVSPQVVDEMEAISNEEFRKLEEKLEKK